MKIFPLAYDSFGVRSMSTFLDLKSLKILIDPGVALAPKRYGLPPTKPELEAKEICRKKIIELSQKSDLLIVTHYHYDHHPYPEDDEMYRKCFKGKKVLAKDITKDINLSGKKRGKIFESKVKGLVKNLEWADGKDYDFNKTHISISPAVWHGDVGSKVGKVIMVYIEKGKNSFLFGSDAQSLADPKALEWVLEKNPKFLIVDGYPTIFVGWKMSQKSFEKATQNLKKAVEKIEAKIIILDHHILRDINYKEKMKSLFDLAKDLGKKILSAAEFYGLENFFLEAWRREIKKGEREVNVKSYFRKLYSKIKV